MATDWWLITMVYNYGVWYLNNYRVNGVSVNQVTKLGGPHIVIMDCVYGYGWLLVIHGMILEVTYHQPTGLETNQWNLREQLQDG